MSAGGRRAPVSDQESTFALLARHLALAVEPLRRAVDDLDSFRAFLFRLGWEPTELPASFRQLATAVDEALAAAEALGDDPDPDDVRAALGAVRDLYQALDAISQAPAGVAGGDAGAFLAELAERLVELLLTDYLAAALPTVSTAMSMLGIVETEYHEATATRPAFLRTRLRFDQVPELFTDPGVLPRRVYGWGTPEFRWELLRDHVHELLWALGFAASIQRVPPELAAGWRTAPPDQVAKPVETRVRLHLFEFAVADQVVEIALELAELPAEQAGTTTLPPGVIVQPALPSQAGTEVHLDPHWTLRVRAGTNLASLFGVLIRPGSVTVRFPFAPDTQLPSAGFGATLSYDAATPAQPQARTLLLGRPGRSRVELGGADLALAIDLDQGVLSVGAVVAVRDLAVVLAAGELDGFLARMLGGGTVTVPVGLGVSWSNRGGFAFAGSAGFETTVAPNLHLGPVELDRVTIALRSGTTTAGSPRLSALAGATIVGDLGPVAFVVEGLGIALDLVLAPGNAGPLGLDVGLKPPTGLGLAIDAGPVQGGGFIDHDPATGRYFGAFAVRLGEVAVTAICLLDTRLPGGQRGFSLLIMLSARFPDIELGFGIALTGVGGLVAVNRRINVDALRERFATGTVGRILAPEDPVRNVAALLPELAAIFPPAEGVFVVGPTLQLTWADLVALDIGVFLELPGPTKVVLLGVARAVVTAPGASGPLLQLRCDVIGVLDLARQTLTIDAVLVDSKLLEVFTVAGGVAVRASWGAEAYFLFSVGGVHPDFDPAPAVLPPTLTRLAMARGTPDDPLYLRFEGYFAITSNSLQFGAAVEVVAKLDPLTVRGFLSLDVLIRFKPFFFQVDFTASLKVQFRGHTLAGVKVTGTISGPGPVTFSGKACIEILFFDICASATFTIGSDAPAVVAAVASAVAELAAALRAPDSLRAEGTDAQVTLGQLPAAVLPPVGLVWSQGRAPLGLLIERFEGNPLARPETVTASAVPGGPAVGGPELDFFAPGGFADLSDGEALNRRGFERLQAGVRLGGAGGASDPIVHPVTVKEVRLPAPPRPPPPVPRPPLAAPDWLLAAAEVRTGTRGGDRPPPRVAVTEAHWQVRGADGQVLADGVSAAQAHQLARATRAGTGFATAAVAAVATGDVVQLTHV